MSLAFQTWPASSMPRVLRPYRIYHRNEHIVYETNSLQNEYCLVDPRVIFIYTPFQKFRAAMWKLQISTNKEAKHLLKGVPPRSLSLSLSSSASGSLSYCAKGCLPTSPSLRFAERNF